jgi:hypothetical protein
MSTMERPNKNIVNCETGEVTIVDLTDEEIVDNEVSVQEMAIVEAAREAQAETTAALKASARAKLISGTPLTEEEAAVLVI